MPARLAVYLPRRPVRQVILDSDEPCLIGRGDDCVLQCDDARLSRRHASIDQQGGEWRLVDLGSKNGTLHNGRRIEAASLRPGDWLSLGGVIARFEFVSEEDLDAERGRARRLRDTTRELRRSLDPRLGLEALLNRVLDSVLELSSLERGFVMLTDDSGRMRITAVRGLSGGDLRGESFSGSWGAIRLSLDEGGALVSGDVDAVAALGDRPSVVQGGIRALASVPLTAADQVIGLVYADSTRPGRQFTQLDLELLEALCAQAAVAIGASRLGRELGELRERLPSEGPVDESLARLIRDRIARYRPVETDAELAGSALAGGDH